MWVKCRVPVSVGLAVSYGLLLSTLSAGEPELAVELVAQVDNFPLQVTHAPVLDDPWRKRYTIACILKINKNCRVIN